MKNWIPDMWQRKVAHSDEYKTFSEFAKHVRDHHSEFLNGDAKHVLNGAEYDPDSFFPEVAAHIDEIYRPEYIQNMIRSYTRQIHPEAYRESPQVTNISNEICGCGNPAYATGPDGRPICKEHLFRALGASEQAEPLDSARQVIDNIPSFTDKEWKDKGIKFNGEPHTGSRINRQLPGAVKYAHDDLHPWPMTEQEAATHVLSSGHHEEIIREMMSQSGLSREESIQGILKYIKSPLRTHTMLHKNQPFGKSSHEHDEEPLEVDVPETIETIIPTTIGVGANARRADKTDKLNSGKDHWQQRYAMDEGEFGEATNPEQHIMTIPCRTCNVDQNISVSPEQQRQLQLPRAQRPLIQDILPHHPVGVRELFISGTCDPCWKKMFR